MLDCFIACGIFFKNILSTSIYFFSGEVCRSGKIADNFFFFNDERKWGLRLTKRVVVLCSIV